MNINDFEFNNIKKGNQVYIISSDDKYEKNDIIVLKNNKNKLEVEITTKYKFNNLLDCFSLLPIDLFGIKSIEEAEINNKNSNPIIVYRIKTIIGNNYIDILDTKLLDLIDISSVNKITIGHSSSEVFSLKLRDGKAAFLKVQYLSSRNDLETEFNRNKWLEDKLNVPKVLYYNRIGNHQYFMTEKKDGISAHKVENFAPLVGNYLKIIHSIDISNCPFNNNDTIELLNIALSKIDVILPNILEIYPDMSREDIINYLKENRPNDRVLVHGDYSLPNILIDKNNFVSIIDLGDVSVSSKYYDLYYIRKSFVRNKKMDCFDQFLKAYGLEELDEKYMKWMDIIDKVLY